MCHAPTIAQTPSGLVAAWFGGSKEGSPDCQIWLSKSVNGEWERPRVVAKEIERDSTGGEYGVPHWNPVLCNTGEELWLFYKVGEKPWSWTNRLLISRDGGGTWEPTWWPLHIIGPDKNPPLVGAATLTWGSSVQAQQGYRGGSWLARIEGCDFGRKQFWMNSLSGMDAIQPALLQVHGGNFTALCRTRGGFVAQSCFYQEADDYWTDLRKTSLKNPNSAIAALSLEDDDHIGTDVVVYNDSNTSRTPLVVACRRHLAGWVNKVVLEDGEGSYAYPTVIAAIPGRLDIVYSVDRKYIQHKIVPLELLE